MSSLQRRKKKESSNSKHRTYHLNQILEWTDAFHERTGKWPNLYSGRIREAPREKWRSVDTALRLGMRGLSGGSSLAKLLEEKRGVRNQMNLPHLQIGQILKWADAYYERHGSWPKESSGPIEDAPGESWLIVDRSLRGGWRGLPGGSSLAQLLEVKRAVRNIKTLPKLTIKRILAWADTHYERTGDWPARDSGPVLDAPGESWTAVYSAVYLGRRGLPGGCSLPQLLAKHRNRRNNKALAPLNLKQILRWVDEHRRRTGTWPRWSSGPIAGANGETWSTVDRALKYGMRGLQGKTSIHRLLKEHRNGE